MTRDPTLVMDILVAAEHAPPGETVFAVAIADSLHRDYADVVEHIRTMILEGLIDARIPQMDGVAIPPRVRIYGVLPPGHDLLEAARDRTPSTLGFRPGSPQA